MKESLVQPSIVESILTPSEATLYNFLAANPQTTFSVEEIGEEAFGFYNLACSKEELANLVRAHVSHTRTKLENVGVSHTIYHNRGLGYFMGPSWQGEDVWFSLSERVLAVKEKVTNETLKLQLLMASEVQATEDGKKMLSTPMFKGLIKLATSHNLSLWESDFRRAAGLQNKEIGKDSFRIYSTKIDKWLKRRECKIGVYTDKRHICLQY